MKMERTTLIALFSAGLIVAGSSSAFAHDRGGANGRGNHGSGAVSSLVTAGTITQTQADAFINAMKPKIDAKFTTKLNTVLVNLVSKNTLTQAKADAVKAAVTGKKQLRGLVSAGTITQVQATAIREGLHALPQEDISVIRDEVLATLVSNNTITQVQANAIKSAKASWVGNMGNHHGVNLGTTGTASLSY
jgi:hypothetical protein